jgi:hypothetical protein
MEGDLNQPIKTPFWPTLPHHQARQKGNQVSAWGLTSSSYERNCGGADNSNEPISIQTGLSWAHELGYQNPRAVKKPFFNKKQTARRLAFASNHLSWTVDDWRSVLWTNELLFELGKNSKAISVWRQTDKRYLPDCLEPTLQSRRS